MLWSSLIIFDSYNIVYWNEFEWIEQIARGGQYDLATLAYLEFLHQKQKQDNNKKNISLPLPDFWLSSHHTIAGIQFHIKVILHLRSDPLESSIPTAWNVHENETKLKNNSTKLNQKKLKCSTSYIDCNTYRTETVYNVNKMKDGTIQNNFPHIACLHAPSFCWSHNTQCALFGIIWRKCVIHALLWFLKCVYAWMHHCGWIWIILQNKKHCRTQTKQTI